MCLVIHLLYFFISVILSDISTMNAALFSSKLNLHTVVCILIRMVNIRFYRCAHLKQRINKREARS